MKTLPDNSVDAIVTDPPYGLSFMGKKWDYDVPSQEIWEEALRVLKPGGYLLSFAGTRTQHRMAVRIEDAGFEIRDLIFWTYASGFPKSLNIFKQLKKSCSCGNMDEYERTKTTPESFVRFMSEANLSPTIPNQKTEGKVLQSGVSEQGLEIQQPESSENVWGKESSVEGGNNAKENPRELSGNDLCEMPERVSTDGEKGRVCDATQTDNGSISKKVAGEDGGNTSHRPQSEEQQDREPCDFCKQYGTQAMGTLGYGTALKPACEPISVCRKPLEKGLNISENVLKYGVGGINIDGCRVEAQKGDKFGGGGLNSPVNGFMGNTENTYKKGTGFRDDTHLGRFPANFIHDGSDEVVDLFPNTKSGKAIRSKSGGKTFGGDNIKPAMEDLGYGDNGSAARFFYCAKSSRSERLLNGFNCATIEVCKEENIEQVQLLVRAILDLVAPNLSIGGYGVSRTEAYPKEDISTIRTVISKITELKTWNLLMQQPTSDYIQDVFGKKTDGGNPANFAEKQKELMTKIGIFQERVGSATEGVKNVTYESLLKLKDENAWEKATSHHPTHKPIALMEYLVKLVSREGAVVLDPFAGSGSTLIACQNLGRKFIGCEMNEDYVKIIQARLGGCEVVKVEEQVKELPNETPKEPPKEVKKEISGLSKCCQSEIVKGYCVSCCENVV